MQTLISFLLGAHVAHAATTKVSPLVTFVGKINRLILNPLITLMFAAALCYFLYGVVQFLINGARAEDREKGQKAMLWGLVGFFIMFGVKGILLLIQSTLGVTTVVPNLP